MQLLSSEDAGLTLANATVEHLGSAGRIEITKRSYCTIVNGGGSKEAIAERISMITKV